MNLINNHGSRYEASSNAPDGTGDATDTHQLSTAMTRPEEGNDDDVIQQNNEADDYNDEDDETVAVSGLLLASMNNIIREMEERRTNRYNTRHLPVRRRQRDSLDGRSSARLRLPQRLFDAETRRSTVLLRRIVRNDDNEYIDDRKVFSAPCKGRSMFTLMDMVDEALQVIAGDQHHDCNDQLYDFHCLPEETFFFTMDPNSTKTTAKRYSCNKEGDIIDKLNKNNTR
jgi:hypothetical protein